MLANAQLLSAAMSICIVQWICALPPLFCTKICLYLQSPKILLLHESLYKANTKPLHRIQSSILKPNPF